MSNMPVRRALLSCIVAFAAVFQTVSAEDSVPMPLDLGSKEIAAYAVVPDVNVLLNSIDAIAKQFAPPDKYMPGMVKMLIGAQLGDPALANLGNKPLVLVLFKLPPGYNPQAGPPDMALFIPANAAAPYDQVFNQGGVTSFADGILTVAPTADALKKANAAKAIYAKIAGAKVDSDLRVFVSVSSLMETFGPILQFAMAGEERKITDKIKNTPPPPGVDIKPETAVKLVKMAFRGGQGFLNQADAIQIDLKLKADSITLSEMFVAKDGSIMAGMMAGGSGAWNKNLEALVNKGMMAGMYNIDAPSVSSAWKNLVAEVAKDPDFGDLAKESMVTAVTDGMDAVSGTAMFSMNVTKEGAFLVDSVGGIIDEKKYADLMEKVSGIFAADSFISKLYAGIGMKMDSKIEKNVRERKGVSINRMTMSIDMPNMPEAQKQNMKKMMRPTESALLKKYYLSSSSPEALDTMIDKVSTGEFSPTGVTLKSRTVFGEGKQMYVDYDMLALMKSMTAADPNNPAAGIFAQLPDGEPMLMAGAMSKGRGQWQVQIPLAPLAKAAKVFQDFGKAIENGGPPKPKPTEDGKF